MMNKRTFILFTLLVAYGITGCAQDRPVNQSNVVMDITVQQFTEMTSVNHGTILDIRTKEEVSGGMIENAVHIDFYSEDFASKVNELDKNRPVYVYCAAGGRSGQAKEILAAQGFHEVYNLSAGYNGWAKKNRK